MEHLHTQKRSAKYRGPTTSDDYNARIEENYRDLLAIVNRAGIMEERQNQSNRFLFNTLLSVSTGITRLQAGMAYFMQGILDAGYKNWVIFADPSVIETDRFDGTSFEVPVSSRCDFQKELGKMLLPAISGSSFSKLKMTNSDGTSVLPSTFAAIAEGVESSADNTAAFVNTNDISEAIVGGIDRVWERNVVVSDVVPGTTTASVKIYIAVPTDLGITADANALSLMTYPLGSVIINDISYTTVVGPSLTDNDNYEPLNRDSLYDGDAESNSHVPPDNTEAHTINGSGPLKFNFGNRPITALRITLTQKEYYVQGDNFIFTYGLTGLDLRYEKRMDSGKLMVRVDAPVGQTFSEPLSVTPIIYNVSQAEIPYIFSTRTIWETSVDSEEYTATPVPFSEKVWLEITLNKTLDNATPELYGLYFD